MALDKNAVIKEAQKFASKGQYDKAIVEWKKLAKESPKDANVCNTIGDLCLKKNAKAEAVDAYKKAADILAQDGFTSKAIALYKKVLNIDPKRIDLHLALGDLNAEKGLTGNALESYKLAADHFMKQNRKAEALGTYQKMADLNPSNVAFRLKLAEMYLTEEMKKEAIKAYLDASNVHIAKNAFQDARLLFEKVLAVEPGNKEVYYKAGLVYYKEGKFNEACKALKPAFENDPQNEEVADLYLDALDKAGRAGDAEEVYRGLLSANPARIELREKLYRLCLDRKEYDKALPEVTALAGARIQEMNFSAAAGQFREFISVTNDPVAAAEALADLFAKEGRVREAAQELTQVADALISRGSPDDAREVLSRATVLDPDFEEAKKKLDGLSAPAEPEAPAAQEAEHAPEEPEVLELAPQPASAAPAVGELPAVEGDDPAVVEALTEADVLIKYGLGAKAVEKLEELVRRYPEHTRIRSKLLELYRDEKNTDKAVIQALLLAELYEKKRMPEEGRSVLQAALELAPGNAQIMARLGVEPAEAETVEEPEAIEAIPDEAVEPGAAFGAPPAAEIPSVDFGETQLEGPSGEVTFDAGPAAAGFGGADSGAEEITFRMPGEAPPSAFEVSATQEDAAPPQSGAGEQPVAEERVSGEGPAAAGAGLETLAQEPLAGADISELWAEAEFYYQQGLFDEARSHYERMLQISPGNKMVMDRILEMTREKEEVQEFSRLAEAVEGLESLVVPPAAVVEEKTTEADVEAVKTLMKELAEMRRAKKKPEQPEPAREIAPAEPAPTAEPRLRKAPERPSPPWPEERFVDIGLDLGSPAGTTQQRAGEEEASDDFFDLAAELRDELSAVPVHKTSGESGGEQSIDEIFEEFKKGVEAHDKKGEDLDTHYNLGVAYKEMGLLDDAISEFGMTPEGEPRFIQSRYLLGLCYLEKGDYQTAITEIQNALGYSYSFGQASEERMDMHYDLGLAHQGVGNTEAALQEFQKVHNLDPAYREVDSKIRELQQGDYVSLDSIKEDIEKEISFKFLEEGARIEREEKTRRSEKVRS
jgi:tetratricopeptide (TPR) repeat protein